MTLPFEMYNSMIAARNLLRHISDPSKSKRVPLSVRREARAVLKHYPWEMDMKEMVSLIAELDEKYTNGTYSRAFRGETSVYSTDKRGWVFYDKRGLNQSQPYETKQEAERQRRMARAIDKDDNRKKATVAKRKTRRI